jgi:hypothetical protein
MPTVAIANANRVRDADMPSGEVGRVLNGAIDILAHNLPPPAPVGAISCAMRSRCCACA